MTCRHCGSDNLMDIGVYWECRRCKRFTSKKPKPPKPVRSSAL